ncbi:hypothetical protein ABB37_01126 [Leptomonas pyrrhocoris]|uniref:Transmembrane protein n=1 Tax=Leptomonas pyrrhocoris TaxID=157538 RepID=A0A0M9G863_LEPPY|nr:hypothetical protein ABB37_01126 [Leptomonas pyrrhocoris]XP_015663037.1 hypothetical protein ABB37_01126 [Leptomonas pyrrhocoris]KPA84597.1 hypothetical protein ABB37_01126 [Leptomonas pyrrhocoris]KPA84598.1 hypothetical protein ABB37_01126 [Leptomonas pyrrhocoris]|eukprot:XP_015663036.1 hypothetical protein ABB37_01126 [Leptomonas pyrrhocoris]
MSQRCIFRSKALPHAALLAQHSLLGHPSGSPTSQFCFSSLEINFTLGVPSTQFTFLRCCLLRRQVRVGGHKSRRAEDAGGCTRRRFRINSRKRPSTRCTVIMLPRCVLLDIVVRRSEFLLLRCVPASLVAQTGAFSRCRFIGKISSFALFLFTCIVQSFFFVCVSLFFYIHPFVQPAWDVNALLPPLRPLRAFLLSLLLPSALMSSRTKANNDVLLCILLMGRKATTIINTNPEARKSKVK